MIDKFLEKYIFPYTEKYIGVRTKTAEGLPIYTRREDMLNTATHLVGVFLGIAMIIACFFNYHSVYGLVGGIIFGASLIILYSASSAYHGIPLSATKTKCVFRILDHCSIFLLVAGTCTPFILNLIERSNDSTEWIFYAVIWALSLSGIALLCISIKKFRSITTIMYFALSVLMITRIASYIGTLGELGIGLFVGGGIVYLIGFIFYGLGTKREWLHSVFHIFCLIACVMHGVCIYMFII